MHTDCTVIGGRLVVPVHPTGGHPIYKTQCLDRTRMYAHTHSRKERRESAVTFLANFRSLATQTSLITLTKISHWHTLLPVYYN